MMSIDKGMIKLNSLRSTKRNA